MTSDAEKRGLRFGAALFVYPPFVRTLFVLCALLSQGACDGASSKAGEKVVRTAHKAEPEASISIPVSVNDAPPVAVRLALDADGFSPALLAHLAPDAAGDWASLVIKGEGGAKLLISLRHYPNAVVALHADLKSGKRRAGLRSPKGPFMEGFVTESPLSISVYDSEHLEQKPAAAKPLRFLSAQGDQKLELSQEDFATLKIEALGGKSSKKARWATLASVLDHLKLELGAAKNLAIFQEGAEEPALLVPVAELSAQPQHVHVKLNRKGQWKLQYSPPEQAPTSLAITRIELH